MITYKIVKSVPTAAVVALYRAGGWWKESAAARRVIPKMVRNSFAFAVAMDEGGRIVGMGRVISDGYSDAYIQDVVVLKKYRGLGIGRGLIDKLVAYCKRRKLPWIGLVAEPGTYPFYRGIGFKDKRGYQLMLMDQEGKKAA